MCEACAVEMYTVVSKAGRRLLTVGSGISLGCLGALYTLANLGFLTVLAVALLGVGTMLGVGTICWGGYLSPKRAERKALLGHRNRQLASQTCDNDDPKL